MAKPRNQQIDLAHTPYYHCVSRCVRRAFLCGQDEKTSKSYDQRRGWIELHILMHRDSNYKRLSLLIR